MESLKVLVGRILSVSESTLNDASSPETIGAWDSFNGLVMVSELEKNFKVNFTIEEVMAVKNLKDIKDILRKYGVSEGLL